MKITECLRENEVMDVVASGRWPDACSDELRLHVARCTICADVLEVVVALHRDCEAADVEVKIPSAGLVWWRAELRARQEAMHAASKPITVVEAFGAAAAGGVVFAIIRRFWPWLRIFVSLPDFSTMSLPQWSIVIAFGIAVLVIAPLAMYLVLSDD
jgi:hypothetical protein